MLGVGLCALPQELSAQGGGFGGSSASGGSSSAPPPPPPPCGCTGTCILLSWMGEQVDPWAATDCSCQPPFTCSCECAASGSVCQTVPVGRLSVDTPTCNTRVDQLCNACPGEPDYSCCEQPPQEPCPICPCTPKPVVDCAGLCAQTTAFWNSVCSSINSGGAAGSQCISTSMMGASVTLCCPAGQTVTSCSLWDNGGALDSSCGVLGGTSNCLSCTFICKCPGISIGCSGGGTVVPPTFPPVTPSVVPGTPTVIAVTPTPPPGGGQPPPNVLLRQ